MGHKSRSVVNALSLAILRKKNVPAFVIDVDTLAWPGKIVDQALTHDRSLQTTILATTSLSAPANPKFLDDGPGRRRPMMIGGGDRWFPAFPRAYIADHY